MTTEQVYIELAKPEERIKIYRLAILILKDKEAPGLCDTTYRIINILYNVRIDTYSARILLSLFPELKPYHKPNTMYWFNSRNERINALNKIIKDYEDSTTISSSK